MAKRPSKKPVKKVLAKKPEVKKEAKKPEVKKQETKKSFKARFADFRAARKEAKKSRVKLHKSFRRSYREDYRRDLEVPGMLAHAFAALKAIFKNWKLFLGLLIITIVLNVFLVGLMNEETYRQFQEVLDQTNAEFAGGKISNVLKATLLMISTITTGGLSGDSSESATVFAVLIFLMVWLCTIYILRHRFAGHVIKLRDALYNSMTPLISTLAVFVIILFQCIPLFILLIVYSTAVATDFLATPFYALVFFIFAMAMVLLSGYLLSSSVIAFVAVSAPGLYPLRAINTASNLMAGRRVRFILRLVFLFFALLFMWVIVVIPLILLDLWLKASFEALAGFPFIPIVLLTMTCFTMFYITTYLYLYYRWMLNYDEK
ncbi:hypothetical protein IKX64_01995 [Candidatus Saccharibacteria bacterium]|nr:hypothetical protein [Candidatus Saccharibacteria bacterium]